MKPSEYQNEQTQIDEGPCDIALPSEIKKMPADVFSKYALWKKECEEEEAQKSARNRKAGFDLKFRENEVEEGHRTLPPIDSERYTERKGLEGPIRARNGKVVYYDPKEGQYYDPDTDIYISNDEWEGMNESSPMPGADYGDTDPDHNTTGDTVEHPTLNGATVELDTYEPGEGWWAVGVNENGEESDEIWIPEAEVKPIKREGEDDNVVGALDTMRNHLNDYNHDPSNRWEKYNQYRNERRQIGQRAKDVTEWGDTDPVSKELVRQKGRPGLANAEDDEKDDKEDVLTKNSRLQARKRRLASLRRTNRRDQQQADEL